MKCATEPLRSALACRPDSSRNAGPSVALVIPIFNEAAHIDELIGDLKRQDYQHIEEIWLVDGMSTDDTLAGISGFAEEDERVRVLSNPRRLPAAALNLAIARTRCDVVMRLDAHARYERDVVSVSIAALLETGAGGVGAIARPVPGRTSMARAIAAAHESPFGVAISSFRREGSEGWSDTVWNGCYWRHVLIETGRFREDLPRAEDNDFHERIRRLGFGLYLSPAIKAYYQPRKTLSSLAAQYRGNGLGVARAIRENPAAFNALHLAPLALVLGLLLPLAASLPFPVLRPLALAPWLLYGAILLAATLHTRKRSSGPQLLLFPVVLATLHGSYGMGELEGFLRWAMARLRPRPTAQRQQGQAR